MLVRSVLLSLWSVAIGQTQAPEPASEVEPAGQASPSLRVIPLPPGTEFQRFTVNAVDNTPESPSARAGAADEKLVYSNTLGTYVVAVPANTRISDDLTLSAGPGCLLRRIEFSVVGRVDLLAPGGPYTVSLALYTNCPRAVPPFQLPVILLPGSSSQASFPDDQNRTIVVDYGGGLPLPTGVSSLWLGITFNRGNAGLVGGAPAQEGFSGDLLDFPSSACGTDLGGFPTNPQASLNVRVFGDSTCTDAHPGYRANRPSGAVYNPGANITLTDDIELGVDQCEMISYEVVVRGYAAYSFELRQTCDTQAIVGTAGFFVPPVGLGSASSVLARSVFDPPITIPRNVMFAASVNNATGGVVVAGNKPGIGDTRDAFQLSDEAGGCSTIDRPDQWDALNLTIICAGPAPRGACCDMYFTDDNGEAVCREVPKMNCPWPPPSSTLHPDWVEGATCDPDPFSSPCGVSACCRSDGVCQNLTLSACRTIEPPDGPGLWTPGRLCEDPEPPDCDFPACQLGQGSCTVAHHNPGCAERDCCIRICSVDDYCCLVEWDRVCVDRAGTECTCPAGGDHCEDINSDQSAVAIGADSLTYFSNLDATEDSTDDGFCCRTDFAGEPGFGTVWFNFIATDPSAKIALCGSREEADTVLNLYAVGGSADGIGACDNLDLIACSDDAEGCGGGTGAHVCFIDLVVGDTYYVMVATKTSAQRGILELEVRSPCFEQPLEPVLHDCNTNNVQDECEVLFGPESDCNANGHPDDCDLADGTALDCNDNAIIDECETVTGKTPDCNRNLRPDECDMRGGTVVDCDGNGVLDSCEAENGTTPDCNHNLRPDSCDLLDGTGPDCNANSSIDECEIAAGSTPDCDDNGIPDQCDLSDGRSPDCNDNRIPDECDVADGITPDCQRNGIPDACDIRGGLSSDCNEDAIPDECLFASGLGTSGPLYREFIAMVDVDGPVAVAAQGQASLPGQFKLILSTHTGSGWHGYFDTYLPEPQTHVVAHSNQVVTIGDYSDGWNSYVRTPTGWSEEGILRPAGLEGCGAGRSIAMHSDRLAVGALDCPSAPVLDAGMVIIFRREQKEWVEEARIVSPQPSEDDGFGRLVALDDQRLIVVSAKVPEGTPRSVNVYRRSEQAWVHEDPLGPDRPVDVPAFGSSVDIDGDVAVVGATRAYTSPLGEPGAVYVFRRVGRRWTQEARLVASSPANGDRFGFSVRLAGERVVVGAPNEAGGRGGVYAFAPIAGQWTLQTHWPTSGAAQPLHLGASISTDGTWVIDSFPGEMTDHGTVYGGAHLFPFPEIDCDLNAIDDLCEIHEGTAEDCDGDRVPDKCQALSSSDRDFDGDVDLTDFVAFVGCFVESATLLPCCGLFDAVPDGTITLSDFAAFQNAFGSGG